MEIKQNKKAYKNELIIYLIEDTQGHVFKVQNCVELKSEVLLYA